MGGDDAATEEEPTCSYVMSSDDWPGDDDSWSRLMDRLGVEASDSNGDGDDRKWACPHPAASRCVFHDDSTPNATGDDVREALAEVDDRDVGDSSIARRGQFLGAEFGEFDLRYDVIGDATLEPICFAGATFHEGCVAVETIFQGSVSFAHATFRGTVSVTDSLFRGDGDVSFAHATFGGPGAVSFEETDFSVGGDVSFAHAEFGGSNEASVRGSDSVSVRGPDEVSFRTSDFENGDDVTFTDADLTGVSHVAFDDADFVNPGEVTFDGIAFDADATVVFDGATFAEDLSLEATGSNAGPFPASADVRFEGCSFENATVHVSSLSGVGLSGVNFTGVDLDDIDFSEADLTDATFVRSSLRGADFTDAELSGAAFENAIIGDGTTFISTGSLARATSTSVALEYAWKVARAYEMDWALVDPILDALYDLQYVPADPRSEYDDHRATDESDEPTDESDESAETAARDDPSRMRRAAEAYTALERAGESTNQTGLQITAYLHRKEMNRREVRAKRSGRPWNRLRALSAQFARFVAGYGESVWRVVGLFGLLIGVTAVTLNVWGTGAVAESAAASLAYAMLGAVGSAGVDPTGPIGFVLALESLVGSGLLALVVFVLGRRTTH